MSQALRIKSWPAFPPPEIVTLAIGPRLPLYIDWITAETQKEVNV